MLASTGVEPPELRTPPAPPALRYLLQHWAELASARQVGGHGMPQPLAWAELAAWQRLTGVPLQPWEARVVMQLDSCWLSAWLLARPAPASA